MSLSPAIGALLQEIVRINPLQSSFIESTLDGITDDELQDLDRYLEFCAARSLDSAYLADCYDVIVKDTLREQTYFMRHGRYRYSTFAEVADAVYFDDEYMSKYMYGLAITAWLWPNHREMHRVFSAAVPRDRQGTYLEIGPGHGMYMQTAMNLSSYECFEGIDLSPTSVAMTRDLLAARDATDGKRYEVHCCDFLQDELRESKYDAIVMGEVLEHVEEPVVFLEKIRERAADNAFVFITTPINAPAVDHIFLFDSLAAIEQIVDQAGLAVRESHMIPYPGETVEESMRQRLPINVTMVLGHQTS